MVIDLDDPTGLAAVGNSNKGRRVIQWSSHQELAFGSDGHNQEWWFIPSGEVNNKPVYKIFNNGFLNFLTDNNSGSPICENGNGTNNQLWELIPANCSNCFFIRNVASRRCIEAPADRNEGTTFMMRNMLTDNTDGMNDHQKFRLLRQADPVFSSFSPGEWIRVSPQHENSQALDLAGGNNADGTNVQTWQWINGNANQYWKAERNSNYFSMKSRAADKCLEIFSFSRDNGGNAVSWSCWGGKNQQWLIIECSRDRGKYILFNRNSGKCLDVSGMARTNGTNFQQWEFVNSNNQKWKIERAH
jgi:hypothetical protein